MKTGASHSIAPEVLTAPANGSEMPSVRKRARKACLNCRRRKTRCDYDLEADGNFASVCRRCVEEHATCEVPIVDRRGGYSNVQAGRERRERHRQLQLRGMALSNMNTESSRAPSEEIRDSADSHSETPPPEESMLRKDLLTAHDAVDILYDASSKMRAQIALDSKMDSNGMVFPPSTPSDYGGDAPTGNVSPTSASMSRSNSGSNTMRPVLNEEELIALSPLVSEGIVQAEELGSLVNIFFNDMVTFYAPYIPYEYKNIQVILKSPALLAVVCTVAARKAYNDNDPIHDALWKYCQTTVSCSMWECPENEVRPLLFAAIILSEWLPQTLLRDGGPEILKRHARVCWPLIGQAVRILRYVHPPNRDIHTYIALHFADHLLSGRLGMQAMLDVEISDEAPFAADIAACSLSDRARLDVVILLNMASKSLYRSPESARHLIDSGQYLVVLNLLHPLAERWKRDYVDIINGKEWWDRTILFEFSHCQLYLYSVALIPWQKLTQMKSEQTPQAVASLSDLQRYLEIATEAAIFIVEHESSEDINIDRRYVPVQWISRLLHASVFLAKSVLLGTVSTSPANRGRVVRTLKKAAATLECMPPSSNRRYCRALRKICDLVEGRSSDSRNSQKRHHNTSARNMSMSLPARVMNMPPMSGPQSPTLVPAQLSMPRERPRGLSQPVSVRPQIDPLSSAKLLHILNPISSSSSSAIIDPLETSGASYPPTTDFQDSQRTSSVSSDDVNQDIWEFLSGADILNDIGPPTPPAQSLLLDVDFGSHSLNP